ncbi:hypothetical protein CDD82_4835 [Ophiocordyceps australis]|uniref:SAC3/GANP/THP3 conserved domain-containing protein n=1 Tax=Ophiocordyceps australis TaxID=1399860 RepID=A0A2C5Z640_9HYPO|nr:hypothetical protein CDD82_4835 [Ophiocordyceps australis]
MSSQLAAAARRLASTNGSTNNNTNGRGGSRGVRGGSLGGRKLTRATGRTSRGGAKSAHGGDGSRGSQVNGRRARGGRRGQRARGSAIRGRSASQGSNDSDVSQGEETDELSRPGSDSESLVDTATGVASDDGLAQRIYQRLETDGIAPPQWPSDYGNHNLMTKFRESWEAYRSRARASLTKAGLIDDPLKRKRLSDAIEFKGICHDMCPDYEKITRIVEQDLNKPEKDQLTGTARPALMIKKLARSAAGQEAPLPMDVRSVQGLRRTLDYMVNRLLADEKNLPELHPFLWDRTRAIRRDFAFFSSMTADEVHSQVYILENITRFHVTSLHLLSRSGKDDERFVEQQELEQLGKTLLSLRDVYDDCNEQGIVCENEAEFRSYFLLFHARDPSILETLQRQWKPQLWHDKHIAKAVTLIEALQDTQEFVGSWKDGQAAPLLAASVSHLSYLSMMEDDGVSYTMACFAECHFEHARRSLLADVKRSLTRPKNAVNDVTAADLNSILRYDTVHEAIEFAEMHGLKFATNPQAPADAASQFLVLDSRASLPHVKLRHQYSYKLVEVKRGNRRLADAIHFTIYEKQPLLAPPTAGVGGDDKDKGNDEGSLFVEDHGYSEPMADSAKKHGEQGSRALNGKDGQDDDNQMARVAESCPPAPLDTQQSTGFGGQAPNPFAKNPFAQAKPTFGSSGSPFAQNPFAPSTTTTFGAVSSASPNAPAEAKASLGFAAKPAVSNPFAPTPPKSTSTPSLSFQQGKVGVGSGAEKPSFTESSSPFQHVFSKFSGATATASASKNAQESANAAPTVTFAIPPAASLVPPAQTVASTASVAAASSGATTANAAPVAKMPATSPFVPAPCAAPPTASESNVATVATPLKTNTLGSTTPADPPPTNLLGGRFSQGVAQSLNSTTESVLESTGLYIPPMADVLSGTVQLGAYMKSDTRVSRDVLGDFNSWFVMGDNGIIPEFLLHEVVTLTKGIYDQYCQASEIQKAQEEEDRVNVEVETFRVYNLSLKYFYRWKRNARAKRLSTVTRKGRDEMRAYLKAKHAERTAQRAQMRTWAKKAQRAALKRPDELISVAKTKGASKREAVDAILACGVLAGVRDERQAALDIVRDDTSLSGSLYSPSDQSDDEPLTEQDKAASGARQQAQLETCSETSMAASTTASPVAESAKTRALRRQYLGQEEKGQEEPGFRLSRSVGHAKSPKGRRRTSNFSSRWVLKAMGIVQLPDGTAVPESLAQEGTEIRYPKTQLPRPSATQAYRAKRQELAATLAPESRSASSPAGAMKPPMSPKRPGTPPHDAKSAPANKPQAVSAISSSTSPGSNKRKRGVDGQGRRAGGDDNDNDDSHKRLLSEAERIRMELAALRAELEEGTEWYRAQNERMRSSTSAAKASSVYDESV